jgi:small-conductance mechanosensitive channel
MKPKLWWALVVAVLSIAAVGLAIWQVRGNLAKNRRLAEAAAENQQLRKHVSDLDRQLAAARAAAQEARPSEAPPASAEHPAESPFARMAVEQARTLQQFQDKLAQANASISQLESRVLDLQAQVHQLGVDNQRLTASEVDLRDSLASANRLSEALQKELKDKNDRILQTEIAGRKLRQQTVADSQRISQITQAISDLRDIHLQQDTTLKNVLRRYREITEQYRSLSGMLENRRGDPGAMNTVDLSRIQNSIALAEDDLRQFSGLIAQAQRIERKIATKSP